MDSHDNKKRIKPGEVSCGICDDSISREFILQNEKDYTPYGDSGDYRTFSLEQLCNRNLSWVHFDCFVELNKISEEDEGDLRVEASVDFCESCGLSYGQNDGYSCQSCEIFEPRFCPECSCKETLGIQVFLCGNCFFDVEEGKRSFVVEITDGDITKLTFTDE